MADWTAPGSFVGLYTFWLERSNADKLAEMQEDVRATVELRESLKKEMSALELLQQRALEHQQRAKKRLAELQELTQAVVEERESLKKKSSATELLQQRALESQQVLKKELARRIEALESLRTNLRASQATAETLRLQLAASEERLQKQAQEPRTSKEAVEDMRKRPGEP